VPVIANVAERDNIDGGFYYAAASGLMSHQDHLLDVMTVTGKTLGENIARAEV